MKSVRNKVYYISLFFLSLLCLSACNVRSTRQLKKEAKSTYGPATVVSESKGKDKNTVVLRDKLQGFEYSISSSLGDVSADGASFGAWENTSCDFEVRLHEYAIENVRNDIDLLCTKHHASWRTPEYYTKDVLLKLSVADASDAKALGEEVAKLLQTQNMNNRMDGVVLYVQDMAGNTLGQVSLPNCTFR